MREKPSTPLEPFLGRKRTVKIQFDTPHQYLFVHEELHHLLVLWRKEQKRSLYLIREENETLHLTYPGQTYTDAVLQLLEPIFFQRLETPHHKIIPAILGATFPHENHLHVMYYHREKPRTHAYFFRLEEEKLVEIPDAIYEKVIDSFRKTCREYIQTTED